MVKRLTKYDTKAGRIVLPRAALERAIPEVTEKQVVYLVCLVTPATNRMEPFSS